MNTIEINTRHGFTSKQVSSALQADVFSSNLFILGDAGSGRLVAVKSVIDQLVADSRFVLSVDCNSEFSSYINAAGGINISAEGYSPELCDAGLINVTFEAVGVMKIREFLTRLLTSPTPPCQYIVIDSVELLFSSFTPEELAGWFSKLNERQTFLIATSNKVADVTLSYSKVVDLHFENILAFRSKHITETASLASGEAMLKTSGVWKDHKVKFVPSADDWERYSVVH
jgi:hypothetical protein